MALNLRQQGFDFKEGGGVDFVKGGGFKTIESVDSIIKLKKGKPSGNKAWMRKQQPRFYWSCSSVVMKDATPLTPPSAWAELHFQM